MKTITLIHYRPDAVDTCRGCEMGRSSSDHEITVHDSIEDAASELAKRVAENKTNRYLPGDWETTILVDGYTEGSAPDIYFDETPTPWDLIPFTANPIVDRLIAEIEETRRITEEARKRVAAELKEKTDRVTLAQLKSKYET